MRSITAQAETALTGPATRPIYLLELDMGSEYFLSSNGSYTIDGEIYTAGDFSVRSIRNWESAEVSLNATTERAGYVQSGQWQLAPCKLHLLTVTDDPILIDPSYVNSDYFVQGERLGKILLIDGVVSSASISERISIQLKNRAMVGIWSPRVRMSGDFLNHLPQVGTRFTWEGENYILEARTNG